MRFRRWCSSAGGGAVLNLSQECVQLVGAEWLRPRLTLISLENLTLVSLKCAVGPSGKCEMTIPSDQQSRAVTPLTGRSFQL